MGQPAGFADEIEQVLRNTFGFEKLRKTLPILANRLLDGVHAYSRYLQKPGQPIKLVDSTGFSLQSIRTVLNSANQEGIKADTWNTPLFRKESNDLKIMMGILLKVPELRENLKAVTGGDEPDGEKLALIIKDWVNGVNIRDIAIRYFKEIDDDEMRAMTKCGQSLFGRLTQTAAWGLGALLSITGGKLSEEQIRVLRNLPSWVYYGVNSDRAITLRLLGVPRTAATKLANSLGDKLSAPLPDVRAYLRKMDEVAWQQALGDQEGKVYREVWNVLEN